ncbi:sigma 54-interacting transcriptional regulator [Nocardiopsis chromatogenes]|uniref:sigma 54-interacting transcriptional regulator n=1 Tax=Nocardiopsis chromatogenes TaxID=280239 RepID=UPI000344F346|nr:sigma 54-interacting transcriptional regulator [Nocardiopsis chromatogenes]
MSALTSPDAFPATLGALRDSGHTPLPVKEEVRRALLERMRAGRPRLPGLVGFDATVLPQVERALLARHDIVLLGERGQGKTRLQRAVAGLLDDWSPAVEGCPIGDDPFAPVCPRCKEAAGRLGDDLPVAWRHRGDRYTGKLATPDTSVADLVGDIDPVRLAQGAALDDPASLHYGLVPRANRGVLGLDELPDLAARVQVALFGVLEEREVQVRGYAVRLPLDLLVVATANPEDYTDRGRIVTPLKDRFGAEVRTHYPLTADDEEALVRQEAAPAGRVLVPGHLVAVVARFARLVRGSASVDARSGVSARFALAAVEAAAASAERRAALTGEKAAVARVADLASAVPALRGKAEFAPGEEGREGEVLDHLLRRAAAEVFRERFAEEDLEPLKAHFAGGGTAEAGAGVPAAGLLASVGPLEGLGVLADRAARGGALQGGDGAPEGPDAAAGEAAAALELAMEGLYLTRRLSKADDGPEEAGAPGGAEGSGGRSVYRT